MANQIQVDWKQLSATNWDTFRAKVPGGWLVAIRVYEGGGVTFFPDPEHRWDGGTLP